jgi:hypothetical protein
MGRIFETLPGTVVSALQGLHAYWAVYLWDPQHPVISAVLDCVGVETVWMSWVNTLRLPQQITSTGHPPYKRPTGWLKNKGPDIWVILGPCSNGCDRVQPANGYLVGDIHHRILDGKFEIGTDWKFGTKDPIPRFVHSTHVGSRDSWLSIIFRMVVTFWFTPEIVSGPLILLRPLGL